MEKLQEEKWLVDFSEMPAVSDKIGFLLYTNAGCAKDVPTVLLDVYKINQRFGTKEGDSKPELWMG